MPRQGHFDRRGNGDDQLLDVRDMRHLGPSGPDDATVSVSPTHWPPPFDELSSKLAEWAGPSTDGVTWVAIITSQVDMKPRPKQLSEQKRPVEWVCSS
jgi:hypothetical protein